ncbi:DUF3099 domain-containing protein [Arsenicicoccus sp. oral taxon 190]|uniref:DUF3099 domain-containing protein n=1 Tax=Arsenicicoccus sp. oral taxon 190 TaxID=1658671 RepID=UPI0020A106DF|nr:DUF3099 domain-containing protein [Arsenicicoccus sp. oral taxon 190]
MSSNESPTPAVHTVTTAPRSLAEDQAMRTKRYLVSMSIRTLCFVLLVVVDHPVRWLFLVAAAVLPYFAVVLANAVDHRSETEMTPLDHRRSLRAATPADREPLEGRVIEAPPTQRDQHV